MAKIFRVIIIVAVLIGIIGLAKSQVAWAANAANQTDQSTLLSEKFSPQGDIDCSLEKNKDKPQCKDKDKKDKDKDKCKKDKDKCGSVKPPPSKIVISVTGEYSIGGLCTLSIVLNDPEIKLDGRIKAPLPRELPDEVQKVRQGCLLTYYSSNERIDELPPDSGNTLICFAATPKKTMTLYFYDLYSANPEWTPVETTVQDGRACAAGNRSGVYVATFQKP